VGLKRLNFDLPKKKNNKKKEGRGVWGVMMPTKTAPLFAVYGLAASLGPKSHLFTTHKTHYARELELRLSLSLPRSLSLSLALSLSLSLS
jgi:hypothetical protein